MSYTATLRSCSMLGLPRPIEASSKVMATSLALELGSNSGGSNMASRLVAQADGDRAAMRLEPLGAGERHGGGGEARQRVRAEPQDRRALHEVEHAQARGEAGAARRRQHVVGAGHIVADHLRRVPPEEDGARVADAP